MENNEITRNYKSMVKNGIGANDIDIVFTISVLEFSSMYIEQRKIDNESIIDYVCYYMDNNFATYKNMTKQEIYKLLDNNIATNFV